MDKVVIALDTNILLDLATPQGRPRADAARRIWRLLSRRVGLGNVSICVTHRTVSEYRRVMLQGWDRVIPLHLRMLRGGNVTPGDIGRLKSVERGFLESQQGASFGDFLETKTGAVLGALPISEGLEAVPVDLIDETDYVDDGEVIGYAAELPERLGDPDWCRGVDADEHDVALLLLADRETRSSEGRVQWIVWTHHSDLSRPADALDLRDVFVAYGPRIHILAEPRALPSTIRQTYGDYMAASLYRQSDEWVSATLRLVSQRLLRSVGRPTGDQPPSEDETRDQLPWPEAVTIDETDETVGDDQAPAWLPLAHARGVEVETSLPSSLVDGRTSEWLDLALDFSDCPGGHGVPRPQIETLREPRAIRWEIGVHAVTHADLPWAIDLGHEDVTPYRVPQLPLETEEGALGLRRHLSATRSFDALVVDLTDLQAQMQPVLCDEAEGMMVDPALDGPALAALVRGLAITESLLLSRLQNASDLQGRVVILHTGWAHAYARGAADVSGDEYQCRHPWVVHPWLTRQAASALRKAGPIGVAVDCPMIDCPLYVAAVVGAKPAIQEAHRLLCDPGPTEKPQASPL